jgi:hypothetical protein
MPALRGVTVCVGPQYASILEITLARNLRHLVECVVVTSPEDEATKAVARSVPDVRVLETDAFTRHGAIFNKWLSSEEGLDLLGRDGWILVWDADCLLPETLPLDRLRPDALHGARRRLLDDPALWHPGLDWSACPLSQDVGPIGFFQLFRADDPAIRDRRPWYDVSFPHAGFGDAYFMTHWPSTNQVVLPVEVLHLGPKDTNWYGTDAEAHALMAAFRARNGWTDPRGAQNGTAGHREVVERVQVPGVAPSNFDPPFTRRFTR